MTDEEKFKAESQARRMRHELQDTAKMVLCSLLISGRHAGESPTHLTVKAHEIATAFLQEVAKYDTGD